MSEKFIKYKYITAAGGKENGRNRSYRYFNYICVGPILIAVLAAEVNH